MRAGRPKRREERRNPQLNIGSSFYMFFLLPLSLPYINWASQEGCLFYQRLSLWSSDQSSICSICSILLFVLLFVLFVLRAEFYLFCFHGLIPLSFSHHPFGFFFPILPNSTKCRIFLTICLQFLHDLIISVSTICVLFT